MKLNRLLGILMILALLLGASGALAEEPVERPPLYVFLADCGWTLYGGAPGENSVVTQPGDPEGLILNAVERVLPRLLPENASVMVLGYNNQLLNPVEAVPAADSAAIHAQVDALRALGEDDRQSSLLHAALESLKGPLIGHAADSDCHLVILTGGAINYASESALNKAMSADILPLAQARGILDELRAAGVTVSAYGYDLAQSPRLNGEHPQADQLLLTKDALGEESFFLTSGDIDDLAAGLCDAFVAAYGQRMTVPDTGMPVAYAVSGGPLKLGDLSGIKDSDLAVIVRASDRQFELMMGPTLQTDLLARQASAPEGDVVRVYVSNIPAKPTVADILPAMDADSDGMLDAQLEVGAEPVCLTFEKNLSDYTFAPGAEGSFSLNADIESNTLTLTAAKAGASTLTVGLADGSEPAQILNVAVADYTLTWHAEENAILPVGAETLIASCDPGAALEGEFDACVEVRGNELYVMPANPAILTLSISVSGREAEGRSFTAQYDLAETERQLTLVSPYFGPQPDQSVQIFDASGAAVPLAGFSVSESALADCFLAQDGTALFIEPKAAGAGEIVLTENVTGQAVTLHLTVNSLFSNALFWVFAAGVPVCLIGFTAMTVLLIVKIKNRKR